MIAQALALILGFVVLRGNTVDSPLLQATSAGSGALEERSEVRRTEKVRVLPQTQPGTPAERLSLAHCGQVGKRLHDQKPCRSHRIEALIIWRCEFRKSLCYRLCGLNLFTLLLGSL